MGADLTKQPQLDEVTASAITLKRILTEKIASPDGKTLIAMARDTRSKLETSTLLGVDVSDVEIFLLETGQKYAQRLAEAFRNEPTDELRAKAHAAIEAARILGADVDSIEARLIAA